MSQEVVYVDQSRLPRALFCTICSEVLKEPLRLPCAHVFCMHCLASWLPRNPRCPIDRSTVTARALRPDKLATEIIAGLDVYCAFKAKGCTMVGPSVFMAAHGQVCRCAAAPQHLATTLPESDSGPLDDFCLRENIHGNLMGQLYCVAHDVVESCVSREHSRQTVAEEQRGEPLWHAGGASAG